MSTNNGTSINFDARDLHEQEEAEYHREEQERQNELRQLLTNAFDDLSDDDDSQVSHDSHMSHASRDSGAHTEEKSELGEQSYQARASWDESAVGHVQTSTPILTGAPPPPTPGFTQGFHPHPGAVLMQQTGIPDNQNYGHTGMEPMVDPDWAMQGPAVNHGIPLGVVHMTQVGQIAGERGETEGGNDDGGGLIYDPNQGQHQQFSSLPNPSVNTQHYDTYPYQGVVHPYTYVPDGAPGQYPMEVGHNYAAPPPDPAEGQMDHMYQPPSMMTAAPVQLSNQLPFPPPVASSLSPPVSRHPPLQHTHASSLSDSYDSYKVQYRGVKEKAPSGGEGDLAKETQPAVNLGMDARPTTPGEDSQNLQREFLNQGGGGDGQKLAQLQILYKARGRKLDELTKDLQVVREDSERDIRILKHKLALVEGERDGLAGSLEQSRQLLQDAKTGEADLHGQVAALHAQVQALTAAKQELIQKLQTSESTIETLNVQLLDLESSESLTRAREQHQAIVNGLQQKFDSEILTLKERLDAANQNCETKDEELHHLKKQVGELVKAAENVHIDRADTINRLTRSLEDSQRQCQDMLQAGTGQELEKMKIRLQEAIAGKSISEDMNAALQDEVKDLKEQISMYESMSTFGLLSNGGPRTSSPCPDDSYSQLGIKKHLPPSELRTPRSMRSSNDTLSSEQTIHGLKNELERCMNTYRNKRQQVSKLQEDLKATRLSLEEVCRKQENTEREAKEYQEKLEQYVERFGPLEEGGGPLSPYKARVQKDVEKLQKDKEALQEEIEELKQRLEEVGQSEEQVNVHNRELSSQMAQMVREFDEDKTRALEKCREACMQLHEDTKQKLREELMSQHNEDRTKLVTAYEQQIATIQRQLEHCQKEVDDVKDLYVTVCQVKDQVEDILKEEWQQKMDKEMTKLQAKLAKEKEEEIAKIKASVTNNTDITMATAKDRWLREQEQELRRQIEAQVAMAKVSWFEEQEKKQDQAINSALAAAQKEWQAKMTLEVDKRVDEAKKTWQADKKKEFEDQLQQELAKSKDTWQQTALDTALRTERGKFEHQLQQEKTAAAERAVAEAKAQWDKSTTEKITEAVSKAQEKWEKEQLSKVSSLVEPGKNIDKNAVDELKKIMETLRTDKVELEKKLAETQESWHDKQQQLIQQKDEERRKAVAEVQDQCERDYRQFLAEHQGTLDKALKSARYQFSQEKKEIQNQHEKELSSVREKEGKEQSKKATQEAEQKYQKDKEQWEQERVALKKEREQEKERMLQMHTEGLSRALEEAKNAWLKEMEDRSASTEENIQQERVLWNQERATLVKELEHRDQLLQTADAHLENEIKKLKADLENAHEEQLQRELATLQGKFEEEFSKRVDSSTSEKEQLVQAMEEMKQQVEDFEQRYREENDTLRAHLAGKEEEIRQLCEKLQESNSIIESCENQKRDFVQCLKECQLQLDKTEKQKKELEECYQQAEIDHAKILQSYKERNQEYKDQTVELKEKLEQEQTKLKNLEQKAQRHIKSLQQRLEQEHDVAMEKMKAKMVEFRNNHVVAMETLRKQHAAEKQELMKTLEQLRQQHVERRHTPTQTEDPGMEKEALYELRAHYMDTVAKIKDDVLKHVAESSERAADTVRVEVSRERSFTSRRLRRYYIDCVKKLVAKSKKSKPSLSGENLTQRDIVPERDTTGVASSRRSKSAGYPIERKPLQEVAFTSDHTSQSIENTFSRSPKSDIGAYLSPREQRKEDWHFNLQSIQDAVVRGKTMMVQTESRTPSEYSPRYTSSSAFNTGASSNSRFSFNKSGHRVESVTPVSDINVPVRFADLRRDRNSQETNRRETADLRLKSDSETDKSDRATSMTPTPDTQRKTYSKGLKVYEPGTSDGASLYFGSDSRYSSANNEHKVRQIYTPVDSSTPREYPSKYSHDRPTDTNIGKTILSRSVPDLSTSLLSADKALNVSGRKDSSHTGRETYKYTSLRSSKAYGTSGSDMALNSTEKPRASLTGEDSPVSSYRFNLSLVDIGGFDDRDSKSAQSSAEKGDSRHFLQTTPLGASYLSPPRREPTPTWTSTFAASKRVDFDDPSPRSRDNHNPGGATAPTSDLKSFSTAMRQITAKEIAGATSGTTMDSDSLFTSKYSMNMKPTSRTQSKPTATKSELQFMHAQVPEDVRRPVALVTRHTQVPSPGPIKMALTAHYDEHLNQEM